MRLDGDSGRDRAYHHLRSKVLTDPAMSGTFINEHQVGTAVGVSRTPVREALLMLAAEDLVQLVPHRGAFVAPVPGRQISEIMQARAVIECWAAVTCLATGQTPVTEMATVLSEQKALVQSGDAYEFIELDSRFHALLVDAADNSVLARLYGSLRARHVLLGVVAVGRSARRRQDVLDEHQAIVDALTVGDGADAERAIRLHLSNTSGVLVQG